MWCNLCHATNPTSFACKKGSLWGCHNHLRNTHRIFTVGDITSAVNSQQNVEDMNDR